MREESSKQVENTVRKGEFAHHEQFFSLSHSVFKRIVMQTRNNKGLFEKALSPKFCHVSFCHFVMTQRWDVSESNRWEKKKSGKLQYLIF